MYILQRDALWLLCTFTGHQGVAFSCSLSSASFGAASSVGAHRQIQQHQHPLGMELVIYERNKDLSPKQRHLLCMASATALSPSQDPSIIFNINNNSPWRNRMSRPFQQESSGTQRKRERGGICRVTVPETSAQTSTRRVDGAG